MTGYTVRVPCDLCGVTVLADEEWEPALCWECAKKEEEW